MTENDRDIERQKDRQTERQKERKIKRQKDTLIWKCDYQQFSMKLAILIVCVEDKSKRKLNRQTDEPTYR